MWRVREPKSHETRAQTPALAFKSGIFIPCPTTWFCRTLQMTSRKPRAVLHESSPEPELQVSSRQTGPDLNSFFECLLFVLPCTELKTRMKTEKKKIIRHLVPTSSSFESVLPNVYLWHRNRTTRMDRRELLGQPVRLTAGGERIKACQALKKPK